MKEPRVSIIIPVYNGSNYIADAIECALNQTYANKEVIVVNDGSTDDGKTEQIALSYGERIRYYSKANGGVSSALNYGISKMTGEYFSWLSHDDGYSPTKLEDSVKLLDKYQQIGKKCIAFTSGYYIDANNKKIKNFPTYFKSDRVYSGLECVRTMTRKGTLNGCCMLIPAYAFSETRLFHEGLRYSQDLLMWYQLFLDGYSLISDNHPNVMYRLHRMQASQNNRHLYEHDAYEIADLLAPSLLENDSTGEIIYRYTKRLTRNRCDKAIEYLIEYMKGAGVLTVKRRISLKMAMLFGRIRYNLVSRVKRLILGVRTAKS